MPKKFSGKPKEGDSFFEKIPNLKAAFGFEQKVEVRLFDSFFDRVRKMFSFADEGAPSLKGRVEEMLPKISSIYSRLAEIKKSALSNDETQDEIKAFIDLILEPLVEEGRSLKEKRESTDPFHQVKILDFYQIWLEKSEFWIGTYQSHSRDSFCRIVNEYIWRDFSLKVERDLKIIKDYIEHAVDALSVSESDKKQVKLTIINSVNEHAVALANLKKLPKEITFKELEEWNRSIDAERQHYFEESLALIDKYVDDAKPFPNIDEHAHLLDMIPLINSIEEQAAGLKHRFRDSNPDEQIAIQEKAALLAGEVHRLSLDLRLPHSIVERLEELQEKLEALKNQ